MQNYVGRACAVFVACAIMCGGALSAHAQDADKVVVLVASSLTAAMTEVGDAYAKTGKPQPVLSFGGISDITSQVENGVPASLFLSSGEEWMDRLATRNLIIPETRTLFLSNTMVLISPADRPLKVNIGPGFALAAALGKGKLALGDPASVPVGKYGKAALESLGVWSSVEANVMRVANGRDIVAIVERGEAAAGITYATEAALTQKVAVVGAFPASSHPASTYSLALIAGHDTPAARTFRDFMLGPEAKAIYRKYGFAVK